MHSTIHRGKRLAVLFGVASLAIGAAGPAAHAEGKQYTDPAGKDNFDCAASHKWYDQRVADSKNTSTSDQARADAAKDAAYELKLAKERGCGYAARIVKAQRLGKFGPTTSVKVRT